MPLINETPEMSIEMLMEMREGFLNHAGDLWEKQSEKILSMLNNSDDKDVNLGFACKLKFKNSEATMEVDLGYGKRYKDKRSQTFKNPNYDGDPAQEKLPLGDHRNGEEELEGTPAAEANGEAETEPKRRGRKKAAKD
jgi:hypothetical protein